MSNYSNRRERADELGEAFPSEESTNENEERVFCCPECKEWIKWKDRVYLKEHDANFCLKCSYDLVYGDESE